MLLVDIEAPPKVLADIVDGVGVLTLNRPAVLNALDLATVRALTHQLDAWADDPAIRAVLLRGSGERAFCAGGDVRSLYQLQRQGSPELGCFFDEEYALDCRIHRYPKPTIALMDGVVMGGGMGIAQAGPQARVRVVTERTKMAMPETGIGLFPDVGGGWFLSRAPGQLGAYLGVTGEVIGAADAIYADLADVFVPGAELAALQDSLINSADARAAIEAFASRFGPQTDPAQSRLAKDRSAIDRHFAFDTVAAIRDSLAADDSEFAQKTLAIMNKRSPLMMCVTLSQIRRAAAMDIADCLRMERTMVRRCFENGEVIEGVRALAIDKDHSPQWRPATLAEVTPAMVDHFFDSAWPSYAHPLRDLD